MDFDIILTTYDTLAAELSGSTNSPSKQRKVLKEIEWFRVVLDEGG